MRYRLRTLLIVLALGFALAFISAYVAIAWEYKRQAGGPAFVEQLPPAP